MDCSYALIPDIQKQKISFLQKIALYYMIDEEKFAQAKQNIGASASIPIGDIMVTPEMNWDKFNEEKSKKLNEYKFDSTTSLDSDFFSSMLSSTSVDAYKACLNANKPVGLVMIIADGNPFSDQITAKITFNTVQGDTTQRRFYCDGFNYELTEASKKKMDTPFKGSAEFNIHFKRNINERTALSVNVSNSGDAGDGSIIVPPRPTVWKNSPERERKNGSIYVHAPNGGDNNKKQTVYPDLGWKMDTSIPISHSYELAGSVQDYRIVPTLSENEASIQLYVDAGGSLDGSVAVSFSAIQVKNPNWINITDKPELME